MAEKTAEEKERVVRVVIFDFLHLMKVGLISMVRPYIILMKNKT